MATSTIGEQVSRFQAQQQAVARRIAKQILADAVPGDIVTIAASSREQVQYFVANVQVHDGDFKARTITALMRGDEVIGLPEGVGVLNARRARPETANRFIAEAQSVQQRFRELHRPAQAQAGDPTLAAHLPNPRTMTGAEAARSFLARNKLAGATVGIVADVSGSASQSVRSAYREFVEALVAAGVDVRVAAVADKLVKSGSWAEVAETVDRHQGGTRVDSLVTDAWKAMGRPTRMIVLTDGEMMWEGWPRRVPARTQVITFEERSGAYVRHALSRAPARVRRQMRRVQLPSADRGAPHVPGMNQRTIDNRMGIADWGAFGSNPWIDPLDSWGA